MKPVARHLVAPPSGSVPDTKIPLSFLDIFWLATKPVQRCFLYKLPSISTSLFLQNLLPNLENSLSLALKHFFPVLGSVVFEPGLRPYIQYDQGNTVSFTVVESDEALFERYVSREQGKLIEYSSLCELVPSLSKDDETANDPLFAVQATVFPNSGICIGIAYKHVLGDGRSIMQFLKTWASICRNSGRVPEDCVKPVVDRTLVPDPGCVLVDTFLKQLAAIPPEFLKKREEPDANEALVRATFYIKGSELKNMKEWILSKLADDEKFHLSSFVVTCSLMWVCLVKSQSAAGKVDDDDDDSFFGFLLDCCNRYEYQSIVPSTYFGNCLSLGCFAGLKKQELRGETGFLRAAKAIGKTIQDTVAKGPMNDADKWFAKLMETIISVHDTIGVAGSPRLGAYSLDMGWGKPEKVEVVSIADPKSISLAELRDDEGGVEAGLVLDKKQMEAFITIFNESQSRYCVSLSVDTDSCCLLATV